MTSTGARLTHERLGQRERVHDASARLGRVRDEGDGDRHGKGLSTIVGSRQAMAAAASAARAPVGATMAPAAANAARWRSRPWGSPSVPSR